MTALSLDSTPLRTAQRETTEKFVCAARKQMAFHSLSSGCLRQLILLFIHLSPSIVFTFLRAAKGKSQAKVEMR